MAAGDFAAAAAEDIGGVFLREFADEHEIAGRRVTCVADDAGEGGKEAALGIGLQRVRVHARATDLAGVDLAPGGTVLFDGNAWTVDDRSDQMGMTVAVLSRNI